MGTDRTTFERRHGTNRWPSTRHWLHRLLTPEQRNAGARRLDRMLAAGNARSDQRTQRK